MASPPHRLVTLPLPQPSTTRALIRPLAIPPAVMACARQTENPMKRPKQTVARTASSRPTVAQRTAALTNAFPKHEHHEAFLDAIIALRAEDLAKADVAPLEDGAAERVARAEFRAALHTMFHPPTDGRFIFIWASAAQARELVHYTQTAWAIGNGKFGELQPMHFHAKDPSETDNKKH